MKFGILPLRVFFDSPLIIVMVIAFLLMFFLLMVIGKRLEVPFTRMLMKLLGIKEQTAAKVIILIMFVVSYVFAYIISDIVLAAIPALG